MIFTAEKDPDQKFCFDLKRVVRWWKGKMYVEKIPFYFVELEGGGSFDLDEKSFNELDAAMRDQDEGG